MNADAPKTPTSVRSASHQPTLDELQPEVRSMKIRAKETYIDPDEREFVANFVTDRAQVGDIWDE